MSLSVRALDHLVLSVEDIGRSATWYERVLGMTLETLAVGDEIRTSVRCGRHAIKLRPITATATAWFSADLPATGCADLCFLTDMPPAEVVAHLTALGIPIAQGPVEKNGALGALLSVYCRDPDGNLVEISSYKKRGVDPTREQLAALAAVKSDDPVIMLNLLAYREDGREYYRRYLIAAQRAVDEVGGSLMLLAEASAPFIGPRDETWDDVLMVRYPSRAAFLRVLTFDYYRAALEDRSRALLRTRIYPLTAKRKL